MNTQDKIELFRTLDKLHRKGSAFIDTIPSSISAAFFDNEYVESLSMANSLMLTHVFGDHTDSISWFLYEWTPGAKVSCNSITKKINNIDEYIDWMAQYEGFK